MQTNSESNKPASFLGGLLFLLVTLATLLYAGLHVKDWLKDEQQLPVQHIMVAGELSVLQKSEIVQAVRNSNRGSFFEIDVNAVHTALEGMPWVYRASVRKRWPNTLYLYIIEQSPRVIWNQDSILNQYGDVFYGGKVGLDMPLPKLYGPAGSEKTALAGYQAMQTLLNGVNLRIKNLFLSERFAWRLELENGVRINLGRQEFIDRMQRFIDLLPLLNKQNKGINYVDLRYDTGLAVGWHEVSKSTSKEQD